MSELGNLLKRLRGENSQASLAAACGLNARTLVRAENGEDVALATVRTLARHFKVSEGDYADLLIAWVKLQLGNDARLLTIQPKHAAKGPRAPTAEEEFLEEFRKLPAKHQKQLSLAIKREEVLNSIRPINELYDNLSKTK